MVRTCASAIIRCTDRRDSTVAEHIAGGVVHVVNLPGMTGRCQLYSAPLLPSPPASLAASARRRVESCCLLCVMVYVPAITFLVLLRET